MKVTLVRHGQTDWNKEKRIQGRGYDIELNETGREQSRRVAEYLKDHEFDGFFSSPLKRAAETADIIAQKYSSLSTVFPIKDLEEMSFGIHEGSMKDESFIQQFIEPTFKAWEKDSSLSWPEGESPFIVQQRMWKSLKKILSSGQHQNICVVSHGMALKFLTMHLDQIDLEMHRSVTSLKNASITMYEFDTNLNSKRICFNHQI